jgi:hypothetical protein
MFERGNTGTAIGRGIRRFLRFERLLCGATIRVE